ncbi:bifunctional phosphopantothenoylcysteine decarboxylase/phosphopantothenate--cysteine ligase CoaBC [Geminicoccus flavidas]|uniref:bifunctional phosphopantothenoylcysteine decarboxylase/phosphopantothenate--cysteine ligase CoaBC n=1 Tax=Geminicoccus flavidas TaxID=2506407 RepID=UPI0013582006|nr:bifunctional phosphopantothenoylcysteine decarboxylase/phosphopantothenate--cysteine ligase CoaBC [Geminicoccus flavidas]
MDQEGIPALPGGRVLLVIGGGIAAYKCLELIRRLKERGIQVRCVLTEAAREFVTPLSVAALSVEKVYGDLFSLTDEAEMGHIRLSREADLVVVAPATANLLAKMAHGLADDLASTVLLATDKPVLVAPAMNQMMWGHPATQRNLALLQADGVAAIGPNAGDMACGETGSGRMAEPAEILAAILGRLGRLGRPGGARAGGLAGLRALVTSGPTREAIDPVRFIMNHSSGKQGHAIAAELARLGAAVTLVSGPVTLPDPPGVAVVRVESAREMLAACQAALPVDVAVCAAAVADWRPEEAPVQKIKKEAGSPPPAIRLVENPDILRTLAADGPERPHLVVGFAAETEQVVAHAAAKLRRKNCDWILANDVAPGSGTFGGDRNAVTLLRRDAEPQPWPPASKVEVAARLAGLIAEEFSRG